MISVDLRGYVGISIGLGVSVCVGHQFGTVDAPKARAPSMCVGRAELWVGDRYVSALLLFFCTCVCASYCFPGQRRAKKNEENKKRMMLWSLLPLGQP